MCSLMFATALDTPLPVHLHITPLAQQISLAGTSVESLAGRTHLYLQWLGRRNPSDPMKTPCGLVQLVADNQENNLGHVGQKLLKSQ